MFNCTKRFVLSFTNDFVTEKATSPTGFSGGPIERDEPVVIAGPPGPTGATGATGQYGDTGQTGATGISVKFHI